MYEHCKQMGIHNMRRWMTVPMALVLAAGAAAVAAPTAFAATPAAAVAECQTAWGSLDKAGGRHTDDYRYMTNIRTGAHPCFDRMVIDIPGTSPAKPVPYRIDYRDSPIGNTTDERRIDIAGGKVLNIVAWAHTVDAQWNKTYPVKLGDKLPGVDLTGYRTFVEARATGMHAGETQISLGVRARLPYRVFQLDNRLVIDVAHTWATTS